MNKYAFVLLLLLALLGIAACGSADEAQVVEKPQHEPATVPQEK